MALLGLSACGDGAKDADFLGQPRYTIEGVLLQDPAWEMRIDAPLRYALFWQVGDGRRLSDTIFEHPDTSRPFEPPAAFVMQIYRDPDAIKALDQALGFILIYADTNRNGRRDFDEAIVGSAPEAFIGFAAQDLAATETVLNAPMQTGYRIVNAPVACALPPRTAPLDECTIRVGEPCFSDNDCYHRARCVESLFASRLPGGMCVVVNDVAENESFVCPTNGRYLPVADGSRLRQLGEQVEGVWVPTCTTDRDCGRPGYGCVPGLEICLPRPQFAVVPGEMDLLPRCVSDFGIGRSN